MDLNDLSGSQRKILREAIVKAFSRADLEMLVSEALDQGLDELVAPGQYTHMVFNLIGVAQRRGWTEQLVRHMQRERPDAPKIKNLMSDLALVEPETDRDKLVEGSLEKTVRERAGIEDFIPWAEKLLDLRRQICRIEDFRDPRKALGTGFLVGPDLVLTNYHVVDLYIDAVDPDLGRVRDTDGLKCRFDYAVESGGVRQGEAKSLASGPAWLVDHSPFSDVDPGDQGGLPKPTELDYALIRLAERVGDEQPPGSDEKRGWVPVSTMVPRPEKSDLVFIVQHPKGDPLKLAHGAVLKLNQNGTRVRYDANTEGGSSGSPCFDGKLNLVALHHGGDPATGKLAKFNQGVLIERIVCHLADRKVVSPFWQS